MNIKDKKEYEFSSSVLAVFAREPRLGEVKTRLQPLLGAERALALHEALIRYVFGNLQSARLCPAELWVAAPPFSSVNQHAHEVFLSLCNERDIHLQEGADLGARMRHAVEHAWSRATSVENVVLVGADCPSVGAEYLRQALTQLEGGESVVIGPADDGGYVLVGLRKGPRNAALCDALFGAVPSGAGLTAEVPDELPWGTERVLEVTRDRLRSAGLTWAELEPRWDVDRPEDLPRLATLRPPFPGI
ncbi:MAG: TIGR04282 family arsenosugar biosynthesis glycosyltransferase [Fluviicoccus sp.]|uniref:TIGR04282 family arsenosugar biosynthesis glycosyltransferase n=1 Tax=Fluviicoccus sp. TaxID=2003552 RepID=UPI00271C34BE|nr:TIGR04282 family arsenosugar biosynthesis glycosyltransferase [Fluviicoccus sp.]MDO8332342.1 TIGR04282 family arsenosugar biosynthesis glycosyltransferase [Fluviicoccus sp.]